MTKLYTPKHELMPNVPKLDNPELQRYLQDLSEKVAEIYRKGRGDLESIMTNGKIGAFSRDLTLASGTQAITGVGYKPTNVLLVAVKQGTFQISIGLDNSVSHLEQYQYAANIWGYYSGQSIALVQDSSNHYDGYISSMDDDGFTITWMKTGTTTGTGYIIYLALR